MSLNHQLVLLLIGRKLLLNLQVNRCRRSRRLFSAAGCTINWIVSASWILYAAWFKIFVSCKLYRVRCICYEYGDFHAFTCRAPDFPFSAICFKLGVYRWEHHQTAVVSYPSNAMIFGLVAGEAMRAYHWNPRNSFLFIVGVFDLDLKDGRNLLRYLTIR